MKIAEALQERADLNTRIASLRNRLNDNSLKQDGTETAEDPAELLAELDHCTQRLEMLIGRINLTNARTSVQGKTLTEWIAERDVLKVRISVLRDLISTASAVGRRSMHTEILTLRTVDVKALQKNVDALSAQLRRTDNLIQETNWTAEL